MPGRGKEAGSKVEGEGNCQIHLLVTRCKIAFKAFSLLLLFRAVDVKIMG